jgi:hypothetical protein
MRSYSVQTAFLKAQNIILFFLKKLTMCAMLRFFCAQSVKNYLRNQ